MRSLIPLLVLIALTPQAHGTPELPGRQGHATAETRGETVGLQAALLAASKRNLTILALEEELESAGHQLAQARGLLLPMVQAGATWTHLDHADTADLGGGFIEMFEELGFPIPDDVESEPVVVRRQDELNGTLGASLAVLDPKSWAAVRLATRGREVAVASVEQARQELLMAVARTWYGARMAGAIVQLQEEQLEASQRHLEVARRKLEAGAGLRIDVVRARADLAQARQGLLNAKLAYESSRDALGVLTGLGGMPSPGSAPRLAIHDLPSAEDAELALARREDVSLARQQVRLAQASLGQSWSALMPSLNLVWQGSYRFTEPTALASDDPARWFTMASLTVPLYSRSSHAELGQKRAMLRQAELRLADREQRAAQEIRQAIRDHRTAQVAVEIAAEQAELAREAAGLTETAFQQGVGSSLEVSDARTGLVGAEINRLTSELQAQVDSIALLRAMGRGMLHVVEATHEP